jgi:hypothetical protein
MATGDPVNQPSGVYKLGFTSSAPSGLTRESQVLRTIANRETVHGENAASAQEIFSNPGMEAEIEASVLTAGYVLPPLGAALPLAGLTGSFCTKAEKREVPLVTRVSLTAEKRDSITVA